MDRRKERLAWVTEHLNPRPATTLCTQIQCLAYPGKTVTTRSSYCSTWQIKSGTNTQTARFLCGERAEGKWPASPLKQLNNWYCCSTPITKSCCSCCHSWKICRSLLHHVIRQTAWSDCRRLSRRRRRQCQLRGKDVRSAPRRHDAGQINVVTKRK